MTGRGRWCPTIKQVDQAGQVQSTPDRACLRAVQTPQAFRLAVYRQAAARCEEDLTGLTDDCAVVEKAGMPVRLVEGDPANLKITTPEDLILAEALLKGRIE